RTLRSLVTYRQRVMLCNPFMLFLYLLILSPLPLLFFFFHDPATTEIYTLSLHDALPISSKSSRPGWMLFATRLCSASIESSSSRDRKSTRLNSSHVSISYAVFCLKKKKMSSSFIMKIEEGEQTTGKSTNVRQDK